MSLNQLPNECLLNIFRFINDFNDLTNCYKVCEKWSHLILYRTRKVEYLIEKSRSGESDGDFGRVYHEREKPIDVTYLLKLLPNLKIADISPAKPKITKHEDISTPSNPLLEQLTKAKYLKGLMNDSNRISYKDKFKYCPNLEMMSIDFTRIYIDEINVNVKQIYSKSPNPMIAFHLTPIFFPNLERLKVFINDDGDTRHTGWDFKNLKIVELMLIPREASGLRFGLQLIDLCPALKSATISAETSSLIIDNSEKHQNLEDLVLYFSQGIKWSSQRRLLAKYPNLKHLALRDNRTLTDKHIGHIVSTLPKLQLLDVRGSHQVTQKSADFVQGYCKQHGRSIKYYFKEDDKQIELDWPQLSTRKEKISRGFNFMKHCFLKYTDDTPHFMDH